MHRVIARRHARAVGGLVLAGAVAVGALLAAGPAAAADTTTTSTGITVVAGTNPNKDTNIAVLEYLPAKVRVATGSTVTWSWKGTIEPHSVTFLAPGQQLPPPGSDPAVFAPTPPTGPYDGTAFVNSGLQPLGPTPPAPFAVTFAKAGTFSYHCVIHPKMVGEVDVVDSGAVQTQKQVTAAAKRQRAKWVAEGAAAKAKLVKHANRSTKNADGTRTWSVQMGATTEHTDILAFAPTPKRVKAGDQVRFVDNSEAPHTATFNGAQPPIVDPESPEAQNPAPGPSPQTLDATALFNTGILPPKVPTGPDQPPPPVAARSYTYVVPAKGTYPYYCILHTLSGMAGEIRAQ